MARIPVVSTDILGLIKDQSPNELDLRAFNELLNARVQDGAIERFNGHQPALAPPSVDPFWLLPAPLQSAYFWIWASSTSVWAFTGGAHEDITRAVGGPYSGGPGAWTGGIFNGIPVLNNGADVPQYWAAPGPGTNLADLPNWQPTVRVKALRPYKNYLVGVDVTKGALRYPQMVKWSHIADPGSVPSSWDETDPTVDAGEFPLSETPGTIIDMLTLRDINIVYKDDSVYAMQPTGSGNIFKFSRIIQEAALLTRNAVKKFNFKGEKHIVFSPDDIFVHDGVTATPILESRLRKWLFRNIDATFYVNSFIVMDFAYSEAWICFPLQGSQYPNMAVVYNYRSGTLCLRELPDIAHAESGIVIDIAGSGDGAVWDGDSATWESDLSSWGERIYNPGSSRVILAKPLTGRNFFAADATDQFDGTPFTTTIERDGLTILGQDRTGKLIQDTTTNKLLTAVYPRIETQSSVTFNIYVGSQENRQSPIVWEGPFVFNPVTDRFITPMVQGKILSLKFEATVQGEFRFYGYDIEVVPVGAF